MLFGLQKTKSLLVAMACTALLAACAGPNVGTNVARGSTAYTVIPAPAGTPTTAEYLIGPLDTVNINVFGEPDLTQTGAVVDASGNIDVPLIGRVRASGRTTSQVAQELEGKWARYYIRPQVTVVVTTAVSQKVTVEGQVATPGVYPLRGSATLLDAIALAQGETAVASLKQTIVFRFVNGQRMAAVFDVGRIRRGDDPDPLILGGDTVVVGYSNARGLWQDFLKAAPVFNIFRRY